MDRAQKNGESLSKSLKTPTRPKKTTTDRPTDRDWCYDRGRSSSVWPRQVSYRWQLQSILLLREVLVTAVLSYQLPVLWAWCRKKLLNSGALGALRIIWCHSTPIAARVLQYSTVRYSTVQYSTPIIARVLQYSTVQYSTVQHSTVQYTTVPLSLHVSYSTVQNSTVHYSTPIVTRVLQYSTVQNSTVHYSTLQYGTVQYSTVQYSTVPPS